MQKGTPKQQNPEETSQETPSETPSLQEKIDADIATGNVSGVRVVEESDAPILGADFFAQHEDTQYVRAVALLRNAKLEYQEFQVYVRIGIESSDEILIREELDRRYPEPDTVKKNRKIRARNKKSTQQERDWINKRVDARMRLVLTRFFYQVPPPDAPPDFEPIPLFTYESEGIGWDVWTLNRSTVNELFLIFRHINPDGIPEEVLNRFQDI